MRNWKYQLLILGTLTTLIIMGGVAWLFQLDRQIKTSLQNKRFLPPTEFYSRAEVISVFHNSSLKPVLDRMAGRGYQRREWSQRLLPGDFALANAEDCRRSVPLALPAEGAQCLMFVARETAEPLLKENPLQLAVFDGGEKILATYRGNPLQPSESALLEPELVAQYLGEEPIQQKYTPLGQIPTACLNAVLAIEDVKFLEHPGVSFSGIGRAVFKNLFRGRVAQGGSTITQQLVKNYFLTPERTLRRKAIEFFMSLILEEHASKDEILETYLNIIYFGQNGSFQVRGLPAASEYYVSKSVQDLDVGECALLAAILNNPGLYDPYRQPENAWKRRNLVLQKMSEFQFISDKEKSEAQARPLPLRQRAQIQETAPYYIDAVRKELKDRGETYDGMKVFTGLDLQAQEFAQGALRAQLAKLENEHPRLKELKAKGKMLEGVFLAADNSTGEILAVVGGRGFRYTQFNRAIEGHRQVGSIMKPLVFLSALEKSGKSGKVYTPTTVLQDSRFTYEYDHQRWSPENYEKKYFGGVPMYFALKNSLNCATASLGLEVGLEAIIDVSRRLGIESPLEKVPSLTLGAFELYPKEVLQAYTALANFGKKRKLMAVRSVVDAEDRVLYQQRLEVAEAVSPEPTAQLVSMMEQTLNSGTARSARLNGFLQPAAGKTGTTSDYKDAWFAGFTPTVTAVAWVGYDDNTPDGLTGASGALPIWTEFMKKMAGRMPGTDFAWPASLVRRKISKSPLEDSTGDIELLFGN